MLDTIPSDARRTLEAILRESLGLGDDVDLNGVAYHETPESGFRRPHPAHRGS